MSEVRVLWDPLRMNSKDQPFFVGQKAFIKNDQGQLLVLNDLFAGLDLPGGKVQSDEEDLKASLQREVKEETGLEIEVGDVFYTWRIHYPLEKVEKKFRDTRTDGNIYRVGYSCRLTGGTLKLSNEHVSCKWIKKTDLSSIKDWGGDFEVVELYFSKFN